MGCWDQLILPDLILSIVARKAQIECQRSTSFNRIFIEIGLNKVARQKSHRLQQSLHQNRVAKNNLIEMQTRNVRMQKNNKNNADLSVPFSFDSPSLARAKIVLSVLRLNLKCKCNANQI